MQLFVVMQLFVAVWINLGKEFIRKCTWDMHCKMIMIDLVIVGHPVNEVYCGTPYQIKQTFHN